MTEPCDLSATEARHLIGVKQLLPTELLESCITRIEAINPAVNAMVASDYDQARITAKAADEAVMRGDILPPLHGLPIGIKDTQDTQGLRTTYGSLVFRDHIPQADLPLVESVRNAGAVIVGKTNIPEWAAGANSRNAVYGATGNPFDPTKSAAGSSGGSAVALATGMVPLATGSDTGGSLRNPASYSGVVAFRPTPGLVPSAGRNNAWSPLSVLGPMARNVPDCALLLSAMVRDDKRDALATTIHGRQVRDGSEFFPVPNHDLSHLRVALTPDFGFAPTEQHIREVFAEKTALFRDIFALAEDASPDCTGCDEAFEVLRAVAFLGALAEKVRNRPQDYGPNIHANIEEGLRYSATDVALAMQTQSKIYQQWQTFFKEYDVVLSPSITLSPRDWHELYPAEIDGNPTRTYFHWLGLAYAVSLVGHPAISVPLGLDRLGMPFGLQVVGPRGGDAHVLRVAATLEQAFKDRPALCRPEPDLALLSTARPISSAPGFFELQ
jgi:Asp-tRNA(Asn)/Glu-tRNA(Gln) amidotransferase A subunit family amidase